MNHQQISNYKRIWKNLEKQPFLRSSWRPAYQCMYISKFRVQSVAGTRMKISPHVNGNLFTVESVRIFAYLHLLLEMNYDNDSDVHHCHKAG